MSSSRKSLKSSSIATSVPVPTYFRCPISLDLMTDPVTASSGITYDRQSIETWLELGNRACPVTNLSITQDELIPNHSLRRLIQEWCVANRSLGIERIPTPRIPLSKIQVTEILSNVSSSSKRGDSVGCGKLAAKLKGLGKESERNRRCIVSCGGARVLSGAFREFSGECDEGSNSRALEEVLSALVCFSPVDEEARRNITSPVCLKSIVSILARGSLAGRVNAITLLRELVAELGIDGIELLGKTSGLVGALVKLIEKPISPHATKSALVTILYLVSSNERLALKFSELGLVSLLLEIAIESDKSMSEKALGVLDGLFSCEKGREMGYENALTVPVLVKKMFRVSDLVTESAVSALWKLCKRYRKEQSCVIEALKVGAFQKLLLLLQVGCNGMTREKASDLLKLMNGLRMSVECVESMDFKGLKRPF